LKSATTVWMLFVTYSYFCTLSGFRDYSQLLGKTVNSSHSRSISTMKIAVALTLFLAVQPSTALLGIGKLKKVFGKVAKGSMPQRTTAGGKKLPPLTLDNKDLDSVFAKNQVWKANTLAKDKDFFKNLGTTHTPEYMYIGKWSSKLPTLVSFMEII
jgi:hypothetical protein